MSWMKKPSVEIVTHASTPKRRLGGDHQPAPRNPIGENAGRQR
jgi:hypothetical protein